MNHHSNNNINKGKQKRPLPFQRTPTDDRKLKIACLPMVIDPKGKKSLMEALKGVCASSEAFAYPSWERYVVRKVSD